MTKKPPVVILCGGKGTRFSFSGDTEHKPKPLIEIGGKPILLHIMQHYMHYGFSDFIICLGYKGELIKRFFLDYEYYENDFTLDLKRGNRVLIDQRKLPNMTVTFADTGEETPTGGRIKKIAPYIKTQYFLATYGDGVSDVDIAALERTFRARRKIALLTGVYAASNYGIVVTDKNLDVVEFSEKPLIKDFINGGFFVFDRRIFEYLEEDSILEREPFRRLVRDKEVSLYHHQGFWHCMDTYKDYEELTAIWTKKQPRFW